MILSNDRLQQWLSPLDGLPLECDGLTRVISTLLTREGIEHRALSGAVTIDGVGRIGFHWWIELADGALCDFRSRMWIGDDERVPHGLFRASPGQHFEASAEHDANLSPTLFWALTGSPIEDFPAFATNAKLKIR